MDDSAADARAHIEFVVINTLYVTVQFNILLEVIERSCYKINDTENVSNDAEV